MIQYSIKKNKQFTIKIAMNKPARRAILKKKKNSQELQIFLNYHIILLYSN